MFPFRNIVLSALASTFVFSASGAHAQTVAVQKSLEAKFARTKTTADRSDIVTAGDVIVLQKDGLLMCGATSSSPPENTYKNGKISQGMMASMKCRTFSPTNLTGAAAPNRKFVSGEKFWVTSVNASSDAVVFGLFSDPISDTRYWATLKIPLSGSATPDEVMALVDQVFKVQPADDALAENSGRSAQPPAPAAPPAPAPTPISSLAPPPPPSDAPPPTPPTLAIGMGRDQVIAMMGQPKSVAKPTKQPTKEIDSYPGLTITYVQGKVTDIE